MLGLGLGLALRRHLIRSSESSGISFTMTAGSSGDYRGYAASGNFGGITPIGNISDEPISNEVLEVCTRHPTFGSVVAFDGDIRSIVSGLSVWVNGVNYGSGVEFAWAFTSGVTIWNRVAGGPEYVNGQTYNIEIK